MRPRNHQPLSVSAMKWAPSGATRMAEMPPKCSVGRTQHETAAEFEQPELPKRGVANVEGRDRLAANLDRDRRRGGRGHLRIARDDRQEQHTCDERRDGTPM